ncbi:hypothetical protein NHH73_17260 [Oxalobacteraceae bacterium OTU3CINTB1]|nr:hypothetical protein NHH73_17260 [Oxalobacteraceae bacterium OTU3CINTB1]
MLSQELGERNRQLLGQRSEKQQMMDRFSIRYVGLRDLNSKLEKSRHQLMLSHKMSAIGQLAAGVAHEINKSIGYINSFFPTFQRK